MIIKEESTQNWLLHRFGVVIDPNDLPIVSTKALDKNRVGPSFTDTFGKKEIYGFVGFIDLKAFSSFCYKKTPEQIRDYLLPFLTNITNLLTENHCLIDKTIGDEIMFILPYMEENEGLPGLIMLGRLFDSIYSYTQNVDYKFRIGLSYGKLYLDELKISEYSEWMIFGESIHVAKRLMSISELQEPNSIIAAIGVRDDLIPQIMPQLDTVNMNCTGFHSNWKSDTILKCDLKGVGSINYSIWRPK